MDAQRLNAISLVIVQSAIEVHRVLGPGLLETVLAVHYAQLLSYLRLADKRLGLFINFNVPVLVKGIKRVANKL